MSKVCPICPINVRYRIWYFRPLFSPVSLNIFLTTKPCKSRYKVFSVTSGNNFLRADKLMLLFSLHSGPLSLRHGVNNCLLNGKLRNFKWPVKPGRSAFWKFDGIFIGSLVHLRSWGLHPPPGRILLVKQAVFSKIWVCRHLQIYENKNIYQQCPERVCGRAESA